MDEIREEIKRLEKELSELKKQVSRTTLRPYLNDDLVEISAIGCLGHIAKAKDGKRVYTAGKYSNNAPLYDLAKKLFKFNKIEELSQDEVKEVADFCNEIIPIYNKYAVNKYVVNFDKQRFDEAYQDIFDYLESVGKGKSAVPCWRATKERELFYINKWREELNNEEAVVNIHG